MNREILKMAIILGLMSTIGPFAIDMYLPALPAIAEDLGAPVSIAQATLTSYFIAFAVAQLFYGPASDMFGRKAPIYFGLGIFGIASIGCVFAPSIETLIALRFVQGLGAAGVMSIPRAIIRDQYTGAEATRLMSTVMLVLSVSPMLAPLVGSFFIVPFGWRAVFIAVSVASAAAILLNFFALPETLAPKDRAPFKFGVMLKSFATLLRDPNYLGLTFIGGFGMASFFTFLGSASFVYMDHFGLNPTEFAIAFAANAAGFFLASQFAANLIRMVGPAVLVRWATLGYATTLLVLLGLFISGLGSFPLLVGIMMFSNLFMGLIIPTSMVLSLEDHGPIAGAAASLGGTMQMFVATIAMVIGGIVFNGTPIPMLTVMAACGSCTFILAILTVRKKTNQPA